jgi:predicted CopG family antitoxin
MVTTIQISERLREELIKLKLYDRETFEELIKRLVKNYTPKKKSLLFTLEEISDPSIHERLAKTLREIDKIDELKTLDEIETEGY